MTFKATNTYGSSLLVACFLPGDSLGGQEGQPALNTPAPANVQILVTGTLNHTAPYFAFGDRAQLTMDFNGFTKDSGVLIFADTPGVDGTISFSVDPAGDTAAFGGPALHLPAEGTYPLTAQFKVWNHADGPTLPLVDLAAAENEVLTASLMLTLRAVHGLAGYSFSGE